MKSSRDALVPNTSLSRRQGLAMLASIAALPLATRIAKGQTAFPARPITVICPYAAGATTDAISRIFAQALSEELKASVIVENRAGAGGNIGTAAAANATPDGHTILLGALGPLATNGALYAKLGFDPIKDFAPLGLVASVPLALVVNAKSPYKNLDDMVQAIRKEADSTSYASAGAGTPMHLAGELFAREAKVKLTHVAYRGSAPAMNDIVGGHVPFMFDALVNVLPQIQGGTLRALATTSATGRPKLLPDVPTLKEAGIDVAVTGWYGFLVPAKTPDNVRQLLSAALAKIVARDDIRKKFSDLGSDPVDSTPDAFTRLIVDETSKWQPLIRSVGIKAD